MERTLRRRRLTARQKEAVYKSHDRDPGEGSRMKRRSKRSRRHGRSEDPEYRNMERSMREEREWDDRERDYDEAEEILSRSGRSHRRGYKTRGRNQQDPVKRRLRTKQAETEARKPRHNDEYKTRRHRRGPSVRTDDGSEAYFNGGQYLYGEHPLSRGRDEYRGTNKRRPGLLGQKDRSGIDQRYGKNEEGLMRKMDEERMYRLGRRKRPRTHKTSTRLAISDYEHRNQFATPFHAMQMYDPIESEYQREEMDENENDDHIYRYAAYQRSGNTEGFGDRQGSRQQGHDWLDEDEYREGHAPRYRGYGKYGSR